MQTLKSTKQFVGISHIETSPVVLDKIDRFRTNVCLLSNRDLSTGIFRREFPGIGNQVIQHLAEQRAIGTYQQVRRNLDDCLAGGFAFR